MARAKPNTRRPKAGAEGERYTAELSTGQLVIGACLLLGFGLGCFLLGVLIGKFDPSLHREVAQAEPEGRSTPPAPAAASATSAPVSSAPARPPADAGLPPEVRVPPRLVDSPQAESSAPAPSNAEAASASPEGPETGTKQTTGAAQTAETSPKPASDESKKPAGDASTSEPPAPEVIASSPPAPPLVVSQAPPKAAAEEAPKPAAPAPATSTRGIYGVQIIAVARPRAEGVKRDIEARSKYRAEVIPIDGDRLCKVVIGRFADERSALQARDDLRRNYQFRDAYVISLP